MEPDNFVHVLRSHADLHPDRLACSFLIDGEDELRTLTYSELDSEARRVADLLASRLVVGSRAVLVYEPCLDFVTALFGCLYAGVVAVPVFPPAPPRFDLGLAHLKRVISDSGAEAILTSEAIKNLAAAMPDLDYALIGLTVIPTDQCSLGDATAWLDPCVQASAIALLQYTSGSTTEPKGVVLRHCNLLANQRAMAWSLQIPDEAVMVSWLPMYHDMGLIGTLMHPLYTGSSTYLMAPHHFLQKPARWLRAISRFHAYISGGPNFAYDLTVRRVSEEERANLDLSSWRIAFNGAEPIRASTVQRFREKFSPCGFRPEALVGCYGLAETTLLVAGARSEDNDALRVDRTSLEQGMVTVTTSDDPNGIDLVSVGRTEPSHEVRIVDPETLSPTPSEKIGEIWFRGPSVATGYWNRPFETAATFVSADDGCGRFLRTGDLGFVRNGLLYVTGRLKDLLIIRGRNLHPQDVEDAAQSADPRLRKGGGVAFATELEGVEAVGLLQETTASEPQDLVEIARAVRVAVFNELHVELAAVYLVPPRMILKTSSGKQRRLASKQALDAGQLNVLYQLRVTTPVATSV